MLEAPRLESRFSNFSVSLIKKEHPESIVTDQMKAFFSAVSSGLVEGIRNSQGIVVPSGGSGGTITGLGNMTAKSLEDRITKKTRKIWGQVGFGGSVYIKAISISVIEELGRAEISSPSAGLAKSIEIKSPTKIAEVIFRKTGFSLTDYNLRFFVALAEAVKEEIFEKGQATIPSSGPGGGPNICIIK